MSNPRASAEALERIVDPARIKKKWNKVDERWWTAADVSEKTLQRFWDGERLRKSSFLPICQAIEVDWELVAESDTPPPTPDTPNPILPPITNEGLPQIPVWRGRDEILDQLAGQVLDEAAPKVLAIVGQGGIGKTGLAVKLIEAVQQQFERVVFFKCQAGTGFDELGRFVLVEGLEVKNPEEFTTPEQQIAAVMRGLGQRRCLLVVDNLESVLEPGTHRATSAALGRLLNGLVYQQHGSRVVLTSREVPKDLGAPKSASRKLNPKRVQLEILEGVADKDSVAILREEYGSTDSDEDLKWIAGRVKGHPLVLEFLGSEYAEMPGYLRQHPELVTDEAAVVVRQQLARRSKEERELLAQMAVLRIPIGVEGLTFLRCYQDEDERFRLAEFGRVATLQPDEIQKTQDLVERLFQSNLVQRQYDRNRVEHIYDMHPLIKEVLQQNFSDKVPSIMQRAYKFYCTDQVLVNPDTLEDFRPILEAIHFAFQTQNYPGAKWLYYRIEKHMKYLGYWNSIVEICTRLIPEIHKSEQSAGSIPLLPPEQMNHYFGVNISRFLPSNKFI